MKIIEAIAFYSFLLAVIVFPVKTHADNSTGDTGNELITYCNDADAAKPDANFGACILLVQGILSGYQTGVFFVVSKMSATPLTGEQILARGFALISFCQPDHATRYQDALVVTKYLKDHPEKLTEWSSTLVIEALTAAWPCPAKK